jgi:hypothetical protein
MKTKKTYLAWTMYERCLIVSHFRKYGMANKELLAGKMPYRTMSSVFCEYDKFYNWRKTGVMEYTPDAKNRNNRPGTREIYTRIIEELGI